MRKEFLGRGWRFPFGFDSQTGAVGTSAYEQNIQESITLILGTRPGERQMLPEFGCRVHELMFTPNGHATASLVAYHVQVSLERWEPRIDVLGVSSNPADNGRIQVSVRYRIKATGDELVHGLMLDTVG